MSVQFIIGGSGTGKTTYIYNQIIEKSLLEGHAPILFVLPEQSNMAAEQEMVMRHPKGGTMDISILSFTRLSFMVFDELGIKTNDILDDYGKSMLIRKILSAIHDQLVFYKNCTDKAGFVDEIKSVLSEFYQYQITDDVLTRVVKDLSSETSLYYKMKDLQLIMKTFDKALEDKYMVAEQVLYLLKEVAGDSAILKNASVYLDGFSGFTPVQYSVLEELMKIGCNLYISITMDQTVVDNNGYGDKELFSMCKKEYIYLYNLASKHQIQIFPPVLLARNYRLKKNSALQHLEQQMFRFPVVDYKEKTEDIHVVSLSAMEEEIAFVAKTIKHYVVEKGYKYKDFAVITSEMTDMLHCWKYYMEQLEIPYFLDCNEALEHNPMLEAVFLLFEIYRTDFSYKSVFSFLKIGFLDIPMEKIYDLENYVIKHGVRGFNWWNKAFRGGTKGLKEINTTRAAFMKELSELSQVFLKKKAAGEEYMKGIYDFMVKHHMAQKLMKQSEEFEEKGLFKEADIYRQIYRKWLEVLDKTVDIFGKDIVERDTIAKILVTGISAIKLGVIPSTLDQVVIGDMERTRLHNVKILFVVGMNDGLMPDLSGTEGILRDKDRKILQSMDVALAPDSIQEVFIQQYYFYMQVTQAEEEVYFSFHRNDIKGIEQNPSYYLNRIFSMFSQLTLEDDRRTCMEDIPFTKKQMISDFASQIMMDAINDDAIYHIMEKYCRQALDDIMRGYLYNNKPTFLNRQLIKDLYGRNMLYSVSKLESYSRCEFAFFLQYGLGIRKREEYKVESNHIGTILHGVAERFFATVKNEGRRMEELTDEERNRMVEELTLQVAKEENETIFESDYRKKHQLQVLIRIAKRSIENLCRHIEKGNMEPIYFEKVFSPEDQLHYIKMALEDDICMELKGIVDRVDIKEMEDAVYFKVIDYKSGAKDIDYLSVYEGKQLQLAVYMSVIKELLERQYPGKKVIPTGMYYYQFQDKIIDGTDEETLEKKRIDNSKMTGLANSDETCRKLMDDMTGEVSPVSYKQNGELAARNGSLVSMEELQQISEFVRNKMTEIGTEIIHGQIDMNPEKGEHASPCNYCDYKSICRFEPGLGGNRYRIQPQLDGTMAKEQIMNFGKEVQPDGMDEGSTENH